MPVTNDPSVGGFDATPAVEAAVAVAGSGLLLVVEDDRADDEVLFCADVVAERDDDEAIHEHLSGVHSSVSLDFTEPDLFEDLFADSGETRALTTFMDDLTAVRVLADGEGLFLALAPDAPTTDVVDAVEEYVRA
ncbi:hypothetical protein [Halomarina oriensis]|uniref:Roadblock/LC7 domain-containing protein n=1 Tax=Halomarina oriensis TaxID=671145 RepID=A0A6B0GN25_9EURY|nr:hypothetical protein [Halomarina oriensis]MWG36070.1 hypothetical protein [Halomarina oriensis]